MLRDILPILIPIAAAIGAAAGGLVSWALRLWWETRVNAASERALVEFQHNLARATATASFDHQRRLQDFNLFVAKKHEALARLHELLLDAMSQIVGFAQGSRVRALLSDSNADDAANYLEHHAKVPGGKRSEILSLWDTDREAAIQLLYAYQDTMQGEHARRAWVKANNYRLRCDLYLPDKISQAASALTGRLEGLRIMTQLDEPGMPSLLVEADQIQSLFAELRALMRTEMARSEFA